MNGRPFDKLRACPVLDTGANEFMNDEEKKKRPCVEGRRSDRDISGRGRLGSDALGCRLHLWRDQAELVAVRVGDYGKPLVRLDEIPEHRSPDGLDSSRSAANTSGTVTSMCTRVLLVFLSETCWK